MDMYKCTCPVGPREVDLDDLNTYSDRLLEKTVFQLHTYCWEIMGKSIFYMKYFYPDSDFGKQSDRVDKMCKEYANRRKEYLTDTPENRLWFLKLIYRFEDEVENQC